MVIEAAPRDLGVPPEALGIHPDTLTYLSERGAFLHIIKPHSIASLRSAGVSFWGDLPEEHPATQIVSAPRIVAVFPGPEGFANLDTYRLTYGNEETYIQSLNAELRKKGVQGITAERGHASDYAQIVHTLSGMGFHLFGSRDNFPWVRTETPAGENSKGEKTRVILGINDQRRGIALSSVPEDANRDSNLRVFPLYRLG